MGALEPGHLVLIVLVALMIFGPGKVAEIGGQLGRGVREFRESIEGRVEREPPSGDRFCARCGRAAQADASFCRECGRALDPAA